MIKVTKMFCCDHCGVKGMIVLKSEEYEECDVVYCPICSADICDSDIKEDEEV